MNIYETDRLVSEYVLFHFGEPDQVLAWPGGPREALGFAERIVRRFSPGEVERALDLGCAVGRSTLEMSRAAREVLGVDYSRALIETARRMQAEGRLEVERPDEGHRRERVVVRMPEGVRPERVRFQRGDAMDLPEELGEFDRVLAANLLCRLAEPGRLLARLPRLVRPGGELILTTPCTWLEEFTPPEHWPAGTTRDWLGARLAGDFELLAGHDEPFLIRETARKFQWTVAQLTKWRRKGAAD